MELRNITAPRMDAIDREAYQAMLARQRTPFQTLQRRIADELERAKELCHREDSKLALRRAQGAVAALRSVLALPARIAKEQQERKK